MSLDAAIDGLHTAVASMAGLTRVYTDPPASLSEFPCAFVVASNGEMSDSGAGGYSLHTIAVEIYQSPNITAQAVDGAKVWPDRMFAALKAAPTLGGAVSHVRWPITYRALGLVYNNVTHYGMRFEITVKVNEQ
jgi:hypothetical protein